MSFYETLCDYYDMLFPMQPATAAFLTHELPPGSRVLDAACGTGTYASALADQGFIVDAIDLEPAMIERARGKHGAVRWLVGDMSRPSTYASIEPYRLIYCIGNSILHLGSKSQVADMLQECAGHLSDGGSLILQVVNVDKVMKQSDARLPVIARPEAGVRFIRSYAPAAEPGRIRFQSKIVLDHPPQTFESEVGLLRLGAEEWDPLLRQAGFASMVRYGGFDRSPFDEQASGALILHARI